jgi:hypothetical protein
MPLLTARHRLPIAELTPCPCLARLCFGPRSCLPHSPPLTPNFLPSHGNHRIQAEGLSPTKLIVKSSTNPQPSCQPPRYSKAFRAEPLLGGESPAITSTAGAVPRARAPPEDAPTAVEDCPSRLRDASLHPSI